MNVAFIDIIGAPYDGGTIDTQGLGGSESAVCLMARELVQLGFTVTVFTNCTLNDCKPGTYNGVEYRPVDDLAQDLPVYDIVISSRTVIPFTDSKDYERLGDGRAQRFKHYNLYDRVVSRAQMRILWMHDTFCLGDNLIEELAVTNRITNIFVLSDFHLTYVANCNHGRRRNFEVLKRKLFITRNGARSFTPVDIRAKDPNLFVYNASVSKGMDILVKEIWPLIKQQIPEAKLTVIGGFYIFNKNDAPDAQEQDWRAMVADPKNKQLDITFTGVIPQYKVSEWLAKSSYMIYPSTFPETYGISTLESMLHNTPLITCRFGALEEVALENACYLMDYPMVANGLFPDVNRAEQIQKFVALTVRAYNDKYLLQQKQYYCNIVKEVAGWDSVAQQWQQLFYKSLGAYLPRENYRAVAKINRSIHDIWPRRYHNELEAEPYKSGREQQIVVISPFYNAEKYIEQCILSVAQQDYDNYVHVLVDDCSTDNSLEVAKATINNLPKGVRKRFNLLHNAENLGAVQNQLRMLRGIQNEDAIVMLLDGDDTLVNDNNIFARYNALFDGTTEFTYGSCWSVVDKIPLISQPYPESVKAERSYRSHHFNWILPYTHLRTFKKYLINDVPDSAFQDKDGNWFKAGGDGSVFYALIEQAEPEKVKCLQKIVYNYNDNNPLNDYKVNGVEQNKAAKEIVERLPVPKKKILIAIPTARNIEADTFKSIYDQIIPEGYEANFQYFYGYRIDQVRNLIADWVVKGYDYLFAVDSDIAFPRDTLKKLLEHNVDMVSGLYIQRKPGQHILEVYEPTASGGTTQIPYDKIKGRGLVEIAGCGFGCVLVKAEVMRAVGHPQFEYHVALDHKNTVSEDTDFCTKARNKGFKIWADTSILCEHIGSSKFTVE